MRCGRAGAVTERRRWKWRTLVALGLGGVLCAALIAPLLAPVMKALAQSQEADLVPSAANEKSTDLLAFVFPIEITLSSSSTVSAAYMTATSTLKGPGLLWGG